jgi:hypothetical protein
MKPVYVKKANPSDRITWMDKFIALEPQGGFRDIFEMARDGRAKTVFTAILGFPGDEKKAAA